MSSGMNIHGTPGRCYGFFQDFIKCKSNLQELGQSVLTKDEFIDKVHKCIESRDDYFECLHGRKEIARRKLILEHQKQQESNKKESSH